MRTADFSDRETQELAKQHFEGRGSRCPRCQARINVKELEISGNATTTLILDCERCGACGEFNPTHLNEMDLKWTLREKIQIEERYWNLGVALCPKDNAILKANKFQPYGSKAIVNFHCPLCGRSFSTDENDGQIDDSSFEGRFDKLQQLGQGGMGTVNLVRERATGRRLAAKFIRSDFQGSVEAVRRFKREERILRELSHTNVVPIVETFMDEHRSVIIMPYIAGGTLDEAIANPSLENETILGYFADAVDGLKYIHSKRIIHRDLKPGNILIDNSDYKARISDFGLALLEIRDSTALTGSRSGLGTPKYWAPEQAVSSKSVTAKADIYSLGLIAYEVASRKSPYTSINTTPFKQELRAAIDRALDQNPNSRPDNGDELLYALRIQFR